MSGEKPELTKEHLGQLPSKWYFYGKLQGKQHLTPCTNRAEEENVIKKIAVFPGMQEYAQEIVRVWCNIHKAGHIGKSDHDWCYAFHYWLGGILSEHLGYSSSFAHTMGEIYREMRTSALGGACQKFCNNIGKDEFDRMKIVYDFTEDYLNIEGQLTTPNQSCSEEYFEHVQKIKENYASVWGSCTGNDNTACCKKFKEIFDRYNAEGPSKLTCKKVGDSTGNQNTGSPRPGSTVTCHSNSDGDSDKLPSQEMYDKFTGAQCTNTDEAVGAGLQSELKSLLGNDENKVKKVVDACYYASEMGDSSNPLYDKLQGFLYFWIGHMFPGTGEDSSFGHHIWDIYIALNIGNLSGKCPSVYTKEISKSLFNDRKKVYDYYHDYSRIGQKLQDSATTNEEEYCERVQEAAAAYEKVQEDCRINSNHRYCIEFNRVYRNSNPQELLSSKCESILAAKAKSHLQEHSKDKSATKLPAAISSVLGIVGLPTAAFFLYKYNILPRWFDNLFEGRSRRKERSVEHHFDALTDDDTSTEYSTEQSVSELTDASTLYNVPPKGGRAANNRRPGNRKNISYQRM